MDVNLILFQNGVLKVELLTTVQYSIMNNIPIKKINVENLIEYSEHLRDGTFLPIGSVEFMQECFNLVGIQQPKNISYPKILFPWLYRNIREGVLEDIQGKCFIKPIKTKLFTGFVFNSESQTANDIEEQNVIDKLPKKTPIFISDVISFMSEWRYYIEGRELLGAGRYDDGPEDSPTPCQEDVYNMVATFSKNGAPSAYSIDVGVLNNGKTALIECNDAYSLGLYKGNMTHQKYIKMLTTRWHEIIGV